MASKTYANLSTVTTTSDTDLVAVYPTGGPLKAIAWVNLVAKLVTDLTPSFLKISNNLSDLNSAGVARNNLGLGTVAVLATGTTNGTVAVLGTGGKTPISTLPGGYLAKSATYSAVIADAGKLIDCTGTFTLTLPAPASVGETYSVDVRNSGSGAITLAPASGTIDGGSTIVVGAGVTRTVINDGTNYYTTPEGPQGWTLLSSQAFTSGSTKTFSDISQGYSELIFIADAITGSSSLARFDVEISSDGTNWTPKWNSSGDTSAQYGSLHFPFYTSASGGVDARFGGPLTAPSWIAPQTSDAERVYALSGGVKYVRFSNLSPRTYTGGTMRCYGK